MGFPGDSVDVSMDELRIFAAAVLQKLLGKIFLFALVLLARRIMDLKNPGAISGRGPRKEQHYHQGKKMGRVKVRKRNRDQI